jgi:YidC/Oxa1 family membrane protein insertase
MDLSKSNAVLAVVVGLAQYWQVKMLPTKKPEIKDRAAHDEDLAAIMNKQMLYFMPVFTVVICFTLPSGLALYWLVTTLVTILQQSLILRGAKPKID